MIFLYMSYFVYIHIFPNGKRYVGLTKQDPTKRWKANGAGYKEYNRFQQRPMYYAIQKYGWENIKHVIYEVDTRNEMIYLEKYLISFYNTQDRRHGYNISSGGEGPFGVKPTPESVKRRADKLRNKPFPHTPEWDLHIKQALNNRPERFIYVYNINNELMYVCSGIKEAKEKTGISEGVLRRRIDSNNQKFNGVSWKNKYIYKKAPR